MRSLDEGNTLMRRPRSRAFEADHDRWVFECRCGRRYVRRKARLIAELRLCRQAGVDLYL
jgi:hypothetical protein